jgi:hypothetical protein
MYVVGVYIYISLFHMLLLFAGQGVKVCPHSDMDALSEPHISATHEAIQNRLRNDREERVQYASPTKDIFCRTGAYLTALRKLGCCRPIVEATPLSATEEENREARQIYMHQIQRGYRPQDGTCEGRLIFEYDTYDNPVVRYVHLLRFTKFILSLPHEDVNITPS